MSDPRSRKTMDHPERLATLETDFGHLQEEFQQFAKQVTHRFDILSNQNRESEARVLERLESLSERGRITWPVIFTAIGTLLAAASIGGLLHTQSLQPLIVSHEEMRDRWKEMSGSLMQSILAQESHVQATREGLAGLEDVPESIDRLQEQVTELRERAAVAEVKLNQLDGQVR